MFDKLFAAQQKAEEIKKRLDTISVFGEVENGAIKITATANKAITAISIDENFLKNADKEELEELLLTAINKAMASAEQVSAAFNAGISARYAGWIRRYVWAIKPLGQPTVYTLGNQS